MYGSWRQVVEIWSAHWVTFHTLPWSKRYPQTEAEYGIVPDRHNTVLSKLVDGASVLVITAGHTGLTDRIATDCRPIPAACERHSLLPIISGSASGRRIAEVRSAAVEHPR